MKNLLKTRKLFKYSRKQTTFSTKSVRDINITQFFDSLTTQLTKSKNVKKKRFFIENPMFSLEKD